MNIKNRADADVNPVISHLSLRVLRTPLHHLAGLLALLSVASFVVFSLVSSYHFEGRIPPSPVFKPVRNLMSIGENVTYPNQPTSDSVIVSNHGNVSSAISYRTSSELHAATVAKYSSFYVISSKQTHYRQCKQLQIRILARDSLKRPKLTGGDYFWVWAHNDELNASAAADQIIDHHNGSYTALVTLFWKGAVEINVTLVHSSEAINIMRRVRDNNTIPRNAYMGSFRSADGTTASKPCHISTNMFIYHFPHYANKTLEFCNYTDSRTGFPWYCVKPENVSCDAYYKHAKPSDSYKKAKATFKSLMTSYEYSTVMDSLRSVKEDPQLSTKVYVNSTTNGATSTHLSCLKNPPSKCVPGLPPRPSLRSAGHYYRDEWISSVCQKQDFTVDNRALISKCLRNKNLHFYGDSTGRQWFEYIVQHFNKNKTMELNITNDKNGPIIGFEPSNNVSLSFQFHGFPFTTGMAKVADIDYVANRLDKLQGGPDSVVFISMWAHFWIADLQFYRDRLRSVKDALIRLQKRTPGTRVFFKTPNTFHGAGKWWGFTLWYAAELDRALREALVGFPYTTVIDVWDMTLGHRTGLNIHPQEVVVAQEVSMLLSFLCPDNSTL